MWTVQTEAPAGTDLRFSRPSSAASVSQVSGGPSARGEYLAMIVPVTMEGDARTKEMTSNAFARLVGSERRAWRGTHALCVPVTTEEVARAAEKISNALAWKVGLERRARRRRTFARGCPAAATGRARQRLRACGSFLNANVTMVMRVAHAKTT